jgi:predicted ATPase/transcriptional regulator with XRE-family HTH domain
MREERPARTDEEVEVPDERSKRPAFGELLRARRVAAGFTQGNLAARASISVQAVSALERGARHAPRGDTLALLTQALALDGKALSEFEAAARAGIKPKLRTTQPLFKSPSSKRAQLPQFATPLFGRGRDARDLAAAIASGGCTTLWGTGGVGKTRLAVETSALVEDRFDRIAFAGLAATIGDDSVDDAIASALDIVRAPGEDLPARIVGELSERRTLVILDNCEHVVAGAARLVGSLSAASPGTAFLCTSREPLRIAGERVVKLAALDQDDARRLFLDRAATVAPGASLSANDERDVATICRRLDGIPLALELAAACARVLDLEHVASGLDERFRLLTRGSRAASDRHTTLHATIAWSYDLLGAAERHVFERAAVINGSFSLDDLLAIAIDERCDRVTVLAAVAALSDKSLIVVEIDGETSRRRYRLLESTRAFALEAAEAGDERSTFVEAHRRWGRYLSDRIRCFAEGYRAGGNWPTGEHHLDHIRGYLDWAIEKRGDVVAGTLLAGEIHLLWDFCGLHAEGIRRIESGLALLPEFDADPTAAMVGWHAVSRLYQRLVRTAESLAPALRAYELAARVGDDFIRASSAAKIAVAHDVMGKHNEALAYAEEAIALFDRIGDCSSAAYAACTAAVIAFTLRGDAAALESLRVAVERQRLVGDVRRTASAELSLGEAYYACGNVDAAIVAASSAIAQFRKTATRFELSVGLTNLGTYLSGSGRIAEAVNVTLEALQIGGEGGHARIVALAAQTCATIAALHGREKRGCVELLGYVTRRYDAIGEIGFTETAAHERLRSALVGILPPSVYADAIRIGKTFDDDKAIAVALRCLEGSG